MHLVLIGAPIIPIPKHPRIHHLGFVDDQDKFDAMAAAELLIMPSYFESLSMVALEAWGHGQARARQRECDVLQGQCLRSNAGLFYENFQEFSEALRAIDGSPSLQAALGRNGRAFFERHYTWPAIVKKYTDMLERLAKGARAHGHRAAAGLVGAPPPQPAACRVGGEGIAVRTVPGAGNRGTGNRIGRKRPRPSSLQAARALQPEARGARIPGPRLRQGSGRGRPRGLQALKTSGPQDLRPRARISAGPRNDRRGRPPRRGRRPQGGR